MSRRRRRRHSGSRTRSRKSQLLSWSLVVFGFLLLLPLASQSFSIALTGIYSNHITRYLEFWKQQSEEQGDDFRIPARELDSVINSAERALALRPDDTKPLAQRLQLYEWETRFSEEKKVHIAEEVALYQKALELRPAWPYLYVDYVMARGRHRELTEDFQGAIVQAARLGPWERRVQEYLAMVGFHYDGWLNPQAQVAVGENLERMAVSYPRRALQIAGLYDQQESVCELLNDRQPFRPCKQP